MIRPATLALALFLAGLAGCNEQVSQPDPVKLTREAIGNYCNMIVADHPGPKIQVHEKGRSDPVWFSSVRDGLAYLSLPGEAHKSRTRSPGCGLPVQYLPVSLSFTNTSRPRDGYEG